MSSLEIGELAALATALLWTISALAWTATGQRIGALAVSFIRLLLASAMMMAYGQAVRGQWFPTDASPHTWYVLAASGLVGFFLCDLCLFQSLLLIGPRLALLILSLTPPIAAVISWFAIGDALTERHWIAMGVTLIGVVWVVLEQPGGHPDKRAHHTRGGVLALVAAVAMAVGFVLSKQGIGDYDAVGATLIRVLGALPGYLVVITLWRRWPAIGAALRNHRAMAVLVFGSLVGPFAGVALNMVALRLTPTIIVATIIATMPVLVLPLSITILREKVSLRAVAGAVSAVAGVALLTL